MKYFGGKNRSGKLIASKLNNIIKEKEIENYGVDVNDPHRTI